LLLLLLVFHLSLAGVVRCRNHHHRRHSSKRNRRAGNGISPALSPANGKVFDVTTFGAVGDSVADDTEAFNAAWNGACGANSGVLLAPAGYKFLVQSTIFTGPCKPGFTFQIEGTIVPPDGPESWPEDLSRRQWLVFYRANDMAIRGGGVIDGRGKKWWNLPCKPHKGGFRVDAPCDSPTAIRFFMSHRVIVEGIKIKHSPQFHVRFDDCAHVHVDSIHITSPFWSPNTDGIHLENSNFVQIYNSRISNGDDCVSIGSGTNNVDIKNVTCGSGHGISIGSLGNHNSLACASNITVRESVIKNSANGVRIKTWQGGSGQVTGVIFDGIFMENVRNPIIIDQFYCLANDCVNRTSAVSVSGVQYRRISGTYSVSAPPMHFGCSDSVPCTNVTLSDIELFPAEGSLVSDPFCWNVYGQIETPTVPPVNCVSEGCPRSFADYNAGIC
ncbi:hypothetical protein M569_11631, partial [Genlisea aurea]